MNLSGFGDRQRDCFREQRGWLELGEELMDEEEEGDCKGCEGTETGEEAGGPPAVELVSLWNARERESGVNLANGQYLLLLKRRGKAEDRKRTRKILIKIHFSVIHKRVGYFPTLCCVGLDRHAFAYMAALGK
jgi:hypothetical protein